MSEKQYSNVYLTSALLYIRRVRTLESGAIAFSGSQHFGEQGGGAWVPVGGIFSPKAWQALANWQKGLSEEEPTPVLIQTKKPRLDPPRSFIPRTGEGAGMPVAQLNYRVNRIVKAKPKGGVWVEIPEEESGKPRENGDRAAVAAAGPDEVEAELPSTEGWDETGHGDDIPF